MDQKANILKMRSKKGEDVKKEMLKLAAEKVAITEQSLNEDEKFLLKNGVSNQGFHYYGSAKFFWLVTSWAPGRWSRPR